MFRERADGNWDCREGRSAHGNPVALFWGYLAVVTAATVFAYLPPGLQGWAHFHGGSGKEGTASTTVTCGLTSTTSTLSCSSESPPRRRLECNGCFCLGAARQVAMAVRRT